MLRSVIISGVKYGSGDGRWTPVTSTPTGDGADVSPEGKDVSLSVYAIQHQSCVGLQMESMLQSDTNTSQRGSHRGTSTRSALVHSTVTALTVMFARDSFTSG